jgi:hypothetical protein
MQGGIPEVKVIIKNIIIKYITYINILNQIMIALSKLKFHTPLSSRGEEPAIL